MIEYKLTKDKNKHNIRTLEYLINGLSIGHINFEIFSKKDTDIFELNKDIENLFSNNYFILIQTIYVSKRFRKRGIGKKLINKFFDIQKRKFSEFDCIILNAHPMELDITLENLKKFYFEFDFSILDETKNNCIMIKKL